jgi:hypothetical protein
VRCSPVSLCLLAAACLLSSAAENPAALPTRTTSFSTPTSLAPSVAIVLQSSRLLVEESVYSCACSRYRYRYSSTRINEARRRYDCLRQHCTPRPRNTCSWLLQTSSAILPGRHLSIRPFACFHPSAKSIVDYQHFPALRLQRRNDQLFAPPALFAAFHLIHQLLARIAFSLTSVRSRLILTIRSVNLSPQPLRISEPSSCPTRSAIWTTDSRTFAKKFSRRRTLTKPLSRSPQYRKAGAPIDFVGPSPRPC